MKKLCKSAVAVVLAAVMVFGGAPTMGLAGLLDWFKGLAVTANAADSVPSGYVGIYTARDLYNIRNNLSKKYILMNNIDLSSYYDWIPIGKSNSPFTGVLDGNGYVILNLKINKNIVQKDYIGLIGYNSGSCYNVDLKNINIEVYSNADIYVGGIVGYNNSVGSLTKGSVENCCVGGRIVVDGGLNVYVGGIEGYTKSPVINDCYNATSITVRDSVTIYAGGLSGYFYYSVYDESTNLLINNCYNYGTLNIKPGISTTNIYTGGIAAYIYYEYTNTTYQNCINYGAISITSNEICNNLINCNLGGVVGYAKMAPGKFYRCANEGSLKANVNATGKIYAGGIVGIFNMYLYSITYSESYNIGDISVTTNSQTSTIYEGGIYGFSYTQGYYCISMYDCFNRANLFAYSPANAYVAGLAGFADSNYFRYVERCYNTGKLNVQASGTKRVEEIGGSPYSGGIGYVIGFVNCYYQLGNNPFITSSDDLKGLTYNQMLLQSSYSGFDFGSVWRLDYSNNDGFPFLRFMSDNSKLTSLDLYTALEYESLRSVNDPEISFDGSKLNISKSGYYSMNISNCTLTNSAVMIFGIVPESTGSHIAAVHCNGLDALVDDVSIPLTGTSSDDAVLDIYIYTDLTSYQEIQLLQKGAVIASSSTGHFSLNASSVPTGDPLDVRVVENSGNKLIKIRTNIKTYEASSKLEIMGSSIDITLPENLFIIGGTKISVSLDDLPVSVQYTDDTIRIGMGASEKSKYTDLYGNISNNPTSTEYSKLWGDWKKYVDDSKRDLQNLIAAGKAHGDVGKMLSSGSFNDFSDRWDWAKKVTNSGFGWKSEAKVFAYLELKKTNGKWQMVGTNGYLAVSVKGEKEWQTAVLGVPVVLKLSGSIEASADFSLGFDFDSSSWYTNCDIDFTIPKVRGSAGIGIAYIADASVYIDLSNKLHLSFTQKYVTGTLNGGLGISGKFLMFEGEKEILKFVDWQYLNESWDENSDLHVSEDNPVSLQSEDIDDDFSSSLNPTLYDTSRYTLETREHLSKQSAWLGDNQTDRASMLKSAGTEVCAENNAEEWDGTERLLQSSIYEAASPKAVSADNGICVMIWTADIKERTRGNHTAVVYSVYDSATDTWLDYSIVSDDGTADFYPDIATDGTDIYVTWVNAKTTFDDSVTITDCAAACEICVAKYDPNTKTFTDVNTLTDNNSSDTNPQIIVKNSVPYVAYMNNSENDPVTQSGTNGIFLAHMNEQGGYTSSKLTTINNPIASIDIGVLNDKVVIAYSTDMDGDITTTSDIEIYIITNVNAYQLTDNELFEQNVGFYKINGQTALSYYCDGMIYCSYDLQQFLPLLDTAPATLTADYIFTEDADGTILLINASGEGDAGSNLYASLISNNSEWSEPVKLTNGDEYIKYYSAYKDNAGSLGVVFTKTVYELTDIDLLETTDLYTTAIQRYHDISVDYIDFDNADVSPSRNLPVTAHMTNMGLYDETSYHVTVNRGGESWFTTQISADIKSGESADITFEFPMPDSIEEVETFSICIVSESNNDHSPDNNSCNINIGYTDLSIVLDKSVSGNATACMIMIYNNSCVDTDATLTVRKNTYDGELLVLYELYNIEANSQSSFFLNAEIISDLFSGGDSACLEIVACKDEVSTGDNSAYMTVRNNIIDEYDYNLIEDNKIEIKKYNGISSNIAIPNTYDDYTVSGIATGAFQGNIKVTSVTIPESVTKIGSLAFSGCVNLTSVVLPQNLTIIDSNAFNNCSSLASIQIPDKVESIAGNAFNGCSSIQSISIPKSVSSIANTAFFNCSALSSIVVDSSNPQYASDNGVLFSRDGTSLITYPQGKTGQYIIPSSVTSIGNYAFYGCDNISSITIHENIDTIGASSFYNCTNLTSVNMTEGLMTIGSNAFNGCSSITTVTIPGTVVSIGSSAYNYCINIKSLELTDGLTTIGSDAFYGCNSLEVITIPDTVTRISEYAYANCTGVKSLTIGKQVNTIDQYAFKNCSGLQTVHFNAVSCSKMGSTSFLTDPVFSQCSALKSIIIGDEVTSIPKKAFYGCSGLTSLTIPESVTTIGTNITQNCPNVNIKCFENSTAHTYAISKNIPYELIHRIRISSENGLIIVGNTLQLSPDVTPASLAAQGVIWLSENSVVATVDPNGLVTGKAAGNVRIIGTTADGSTAASYTIQVKPSVATVIINNYSGGYSQKVEWWKSYSTAKMNLGYQAYNCDGAVHYEWSSSNKKVNIDQNGNITNIGSFARSATITLTAYNADGNVVAKNSVKVSFYKFSWQKSKVQSQSVLSDNWFGQKLTVQELEKIESERTENPTLDRVCSVLDWLSNAFLFIVKSIGIFPIQTS